MFEAYKVATTLALNNQVSAVLGFIARDFIKVDKEAKKLQATLKEIKLLGMTGAILGGAGFMGLGAIKAAVKPASEYVHQLQLAKAAGMSQLEIAKATSAAWKATSQVMTTSAAGNLAAIRELRMVFGDTRDAIEYMPVVQKLQAILQNVRGLNSGDEAYNVAKALEMKGDVKNAARFTTGADLMTKAIVASGGKVTAQDFLMAFKYGRSATLGWDDRFTYSILPTLIQEMKSAGSVSGNGMGGPGNALMSAYMAVVGGTVPQKSLALWQKLGLLDPSKIVWNKVGTAKGIHPGGILGSEIFQHDPYQWVNQFLVPALVKAGYQTPERQREALQYLFPSRTAGFVIGQMALQGWKFDRDQRLIAQASGLSAYDLMIRRDPNMAYAALGAQWLNFKTALGITVVPMVVSFVRGLTSALNSLARFAEDHPTITKSLMLTFAGLSSLAAIGGTLMIAGAALKLVGVGFGLLGSPLTLLAGIPLAGIATGIGLLGTALAALAPIVYHKEVAGWIDRHAPGIGDALYHVFTPQGRADIGGHGYAPPASGRPIHVHTQLHLDGRPIAKVVTQHQYYDMNRDLASGSGFDSRLSFSSPGVP